MNLVFQHIHSNVKELGIQSMELLELFQGEELLCGHALSWNSMCS